MIDKATFEAHVRAEANREHPDETPGVICIGDIHAASKRNAYIATRMEHEWKLVEIGMKLLNEYNDEQVRMRTPIAYLRKFEELKNELAKLEAQ